MNLHSIPVASSISPATVGKWKMEIATRSAQLHKMVKMVWNHIGIVLFILGFGFFTSVAIWGSMEVPDSMSTSHAHMAKHEYYKSHKSSPTYGSSYGTISDEDYLGLLDIPDFLDVLDTPVGSSPQFKAGSPLVGSSRSSLQSPEQKGTGDGLHERLLIHEGSVELQCVASDMDALAERISAHAALNAKGYVESRKKSQGYIHIQLRIANSMFHDVIRDIRNMVSADPQGLVSLSTSTRDVTEQYIDSTARASTIEKSRQALELLLNQATTVRDVLIVQRELTSMTPEIESHTKRAKSLKKASDMSSLSITIRERTQDDLYSKRIVIWDPIQTVSETVYQMKIALSFLGDVLIYAVLWSVPLFVLMSLLSFLLRKPSVAMDLC